MRLKTKNGKYIETREDMETELVQYFGTIVKEDRLDITKEIRKVTKHITRQVSANQNEALFKVELQEVEEVVSQMEDGKSLVPNGFTTKLFHYFWDLIKEEVSRIGEVSRKDES